MKRFSFHWGWGISIVYASFALATLSFVAFAMTQDVDLVREDYYQHSLEQDDVAAARKAARMLGNDVGLQFTPTDLHIRIPKHHVGRATGLVYLYHSADPARDQTKVLQVDSTGLMLISTSVLPPGSWRITVTWSVDHEHFETTGSLRIK